MRHPRSLLNDSAVQDRQFIDQIIQGGPEIINAIDDGEAEAQGNDQGPVKVYWQPPKRTRIVADRNLIYIGLPEGAERLFKFIKVSYCPFYPEGSPVECV